VSTLGFCSRDQKEEFLMSDITQSISESAARERVDSLRNAASPASPADLADALLTWSYALAREGHSVEAMAAAEEAVRTFAPVFLASPTANAEAMNAMVAEYLGMSQHCNRKPDTALIESLAVPLARAEPDDEEE
jgi:hypothetical protein